MILYQHYNGEIPIFQLARFFKATSRVNRSEFMGRAPRSLLFMGLRTNELAEPPRMEAHFDEVGQSVPYGETDMDIFEGWMREEA